MNKQPTSWDLLAGIRFALAAIVLVAHTNVRADEHWALHGFADLGAFSAVIGFLILSGYSIGHSYSRSPKGYFGRRLLRIYPLYAAAVLLTMVVSLVGHISHSGPIDYAVGRMLKDTVGNLLFMQTYRYVPMPGNAVVWTLAVEVTFYALTPLLARLSTTVLIGAAAVSAGMFCTYSHTHLPYVAYTFHGVATLTLGWAWLGGFVYYRHRTDPAAGVLLTAAVVGCCSIYTDYNSPYSIPTLLITMLALICGGAWQLPGVVRKTLAFLGEVSYPLYLFHPPAFLLCYWKLQTHNPVVLIAASMAVTLVFVALDLMARKPLLRAWTKLEARTAGFGQYVLARPWVRPILHGGFGVARWSSTQVAAAS